MVEIKLKYQGVTYRIYDKYFDRAEEAHYMYTEGNYSCDDNRSLMIQSQCDTGFPFLGCGNTIQLISMKTVKSGVTKRAKNKIN